jgi:hypothetical protein
LFVVCTQTFSSLFCRPKTSRMNFLLLLLSASIRLREGIFWRLSQTIFPRFLAFSSFLFLFGVNKFSSFFRINPERNEKLPPLALRSLPRRDLIRIPSRAFLSDAKEIKSNETRFRPARLPGRLNLVRVEDTMNPPDEHRR